MRDHVAALLQHFDPHPQREGIKETPERYIKAMTELTSGYSVDPEKLLKTFGDGGEQYNEMVFIGSIPMYSLCEHHLVPFFGVAHVAYIPSGGRIVGLSKIPRLVDAFSKRFTVQERITTLVADTINKVLAPRGTAVMIQARHMCMEMRGVQRPGTVTTTTALRGSLMEPSARSEFYSMVSNAKGVGIG